MPARSFPARLAIWMVICSISAAPSFVTALNEFSRADQIVAMLLGIVIFIFAYTFATGTTLARRLNEHTLVRRTAYIGYGTRIALSIIWPVGASLDIICGIVTGFMIDFVFDGTHDTFIAILTWTLLQGGLLNIVLFTYMSVVLGVQVPFYRPTPAGCCAKCGYDLRASAERCPECGEAINV